MRQYDLKGRLTYQSLGTADTRLYGYDPNGNLTQKQSLPEVGTYGYDTLDRLISTNRDAGTETYGYDANGNRLSDVRGTYNYLSATNRLSTTPEATITLDPAGNVLSDGTRSFSYNAAGHLASAPGATYVYDHRRLRTRKTTGTQTVVYHYDLEGRLLLETNAQGQVLRAYVWAENEPVAQIDTGERLTYLHTDHLGTVRLATNTSGAKVWSWEGEAFGDTLPHQDPDNDGIETVVNLRYPGQYVDAETGLFYNWNRYYDPKIGRYITADPLGVVPGVGDSPTVPHYITKYLRSVPLKQRLLRGLNHPYAYVDNRPLTLIDPFGLYSTTSCSYYQQRCEEVGGVYYCYLAPSVCNNFPDGNWSNCVRQCLQEYDWGYCKPESTCGGGSSFPCVVNIHQMCWQECVGGGPPRPEAGPPEYQ